MLRVTEICKEKGITQQMLANKLGIQYQSLYAALNGNPKLETLQNIANALNVNIVDLFEKREDIELFVKYNGEMYPLTNKDIIEIISKK